MGERPSEYIRDENDWYVEPEWTVKALTDKIDIVGTVHDPCCGMGTIPKWFDPYSTGADIVDRGYGYETRDFLTDNIQYDSIVTNPPYGIAQAIIEQALRLTKYQVAALVQTKFLASQKRHGLFTRPEMERVIMFSRRPSMPPGEMLRQHGESIRGGGSIDFCWAVWNNRHDGSPVKIEWSM